MTSIIQYFIPIVRKDRHWYISQELLGQHAEKYLVRNAVPTTLFWMLDLVFLYTNPLLAAIFITIALPFACTTGLLLKARAQYKN